MGCPTEVEIGSNLVFSICTHDPDTGVLTDAASDPTYRVYEDETGTAILNGTMSKLDDATTTGFYSELIDCTTGNEFEESKTYTIYIEATVDGSTGGISYGFKATEVASEMVNAQVLDVLNVDTFAEPGQGEPSETPTMREMFHYVFKWWRNKKVNDGNETTLYANNGTTADQKQTTSTGGGAVTLDKWATGA